MRKDQIDELYYLLRETSNEGHRQQSTEITDAMYGLAGHLLAGRDYLRLVQYSKYYGDKFLLEPTYEAIRRRGWVPERFVDLGAGLGWLGRGLASKFKIASILSVDKRRWAVIDVLADLETPKGIRELQELLKEGDIIVMSDFLHCVENPHEILTAFSEHPMAVLEYSSTNPDYARNYRDQLERYGGDYIDPEELTRMLSDLGRTVDIEDLDPYILVLIDPKRE